MEEMYIRSQDGRKLLKMGEGVEYMVLKPMESHAVCMINPNLHENWINPNHREGWAVLGVYADKERCLKVMDEIERKYEEYLYESGYPGVGPTVASIPRVYRMPKI